MPVSPLEPNDPRRLGDFELTGRLGAGGMGVVYLGKGADGELVAVKLVRADLAHDATFRERFRREVEALRRVSGPRVARLLAADTEAPQPFLVTEYVDGPTLADSVAANGPVAGERLRALAAALAEAIVVIHEVGVIHRDLKPSNVILAADQPKLVDFGIAAAAGSMPLTMAGTVIGSAGWMAPEQAAGEVSTPAVDVFTWASLVAFAGTGRPPYGVGGPEEVTARIMNGEADLRGLPQEVRPFVEAAFIRDPAQRPSARAVLSGLVGRDEASTDELVEETTHLIENTWVMPVGGWPAAAASTPAQPPAPPTVATPMPMAAPPLPPAGAAAPAPAPAHRRMWPLLVAVGVICLLIGVAGALVLGGGGSDGDGGEGASATTVAAPAPTIPDPTTTAAPTTTTIPGPVPVDLTVELTNVRNDLTDLPGQIDPCSEAAFVSIESAEGDVLVDETQFPHGQPIPGTGDLADCLYSLDLPAVELTDDIAVFISDDFGEFDPDEFSRAEIEAAGGLIQIELDGLGSL